MIIPEHLVDDIRKHVRASIRPEREIVGRLVVQDGVAIRYDRLRNWARGDWRFSTHHGDREAGLCDGEDAVLVHSHPKTGIDNTKPSDADMSGASKNWWGLPYLIFHVQSDRLYGYVLLSRKEWLPYPLGIVRS